MNTRATVLLITLAVASAASVAQTFKPKSGFEWLSGQDALLVLNRCDECLDGVDAFVDAVISGTSSVMVMCTSQRLLGLPGEVAWRLAPLDIDDAVALFVDRARAVGVHELDRAAVATVCERIDRLPFVIEIV